MKYRVRKTSIGCCFEGSEEFDNFDDAIASARAWGPHFDGNDKVDRWSHYRSDAHVLEALHASEDKALSTWEDHAPCVGPCRDHMEDFCNIYLI